MSPRFSVLLPTHNRADVIGFAIRSVLWQTEQDFELLIVGDGCNDRTAEVVAQFDDARIRWFDLPKAPLSGYANRNIVLRQARGHYIAYAQHDDIFFPDHLSLLAAAAERKSAQWCYSRPLWIEPDGLIAPFAIDLTKAEELAAYRRRNVIPSCCVLHTRSLLQQAGYWPEDVATAADWACWNRMFDFAGEACIAYCPQPTTLHFRAAWKKDDTFTMPEVRTIAKIADEHQWWPPAFRLAIPAGMTEQQAVFERMSGAPRHYCRSLRAAVRKVYGRTLFRREPRLAWSRIVQ
jgi:glycosyltransferase involved in cell wall biosynthesis